MHKITERVLSYRECTRHIWNTYFRLLNDGEHLFGNVDNELFSALVLSSPQEMSLSSYIQGTPCQSLIVRPKEYDRGTPALWAREEDERYWRWASTVLHRTITLYFISFFDWDVYGMRD